MKLISLRTAVVLSTLAAPFFCLADSKAIEAAQLAVRRAIRSELGAGYRVSFEESKEDILSFTEEVVSGVGHASQGNSWQFERSFTYKIKVKYDGSQTRELILTFDNGSVKKDNANWERADHSDEFVHISKPGWYQSFSSNNVTFEGEAYGPVTITVFDRDNRKIGDTTTTARNGRFSTSMRLPNGVFRAQVQPSLSLDWDEVRFSVNSYTDDWGTKGKPGSRPKDGVENIVSIRQPGNGRTVRGPRVTIAGDCSERTARIEIWDSRNNQIVDRTVGTRNGSFSADFDLKSGDYRLLVESASGRDSDVWRFSVETASQLPIGKPNPGVEDIVQISQPSNGGTENGRVTIAGNCSERSVRVQVWDARNNKVLDRNVPTRNNYFNTQVALPDGDYRMTVDSESGRDSDAWSFRVRGVGGGEVSNPSNSGGSVEDIVQIFSPKNNGTVGSAHTIAGSCKEGSVKVSVYDPSNKVIYDGRVSVSRGSWSVTVRDMKKGSYRLVVRSESGKDTDAISFMVK